MNASEKTKKPAVLFGFTAGYQSAAAPPITRFTSGPATETRKLRPGVCGSGLNWVRPMKPFTEMASTSNRRLCATSACPSSCRTMQTMRISEAARPRV